MKLAICLLIALAGLTAADEARPGPPAKLVQDPDNMPWLGLKVGRLDPAIRSHVPDLPEGIGFVVTSIDPGGPAEKGGLKAYDIFWKFGDQLIANEAQLFTLLRLRDDGDKVELGVYRSGRALTLPVVLSRLPEERVLGHLPDLDVPARAANQPDAPMKILKPAERTAEIETADGKAVLSIVAGSPEVKIITSDGAPVFEGPVYDFNGVCQVPDPWKPRVGALERALAHAMKGNPAPRSPRARVLPPAKPAEK